MTAWMPASSSARCRASGSRICSPLSASFTWLSDALLNVHPTGTIFAGRHEPLRVWILCLYFMGLNLSNEQTAQELGIDPDDAQVMASQLREGIVERKPEVKLGGEVECDEVYVVAGHKGHSEAVRKKGGLAAPKGEPRASARTGSRSIRPRPRDAAD